jgi:putative transposase
LIEPAHPELSIARQCDLLALPRSSWYYQPAGERAENLVLMRLLDEQYTRTPFYGVRRMTAWLGQQGYPVNVKRVRRLLRLMGLEAIYPKPCLSVPGATAQRYPYLLRDLPITQVDQVWSTDITYVRMRRGFLSLVAILDWYSRYVLAWELSNTLDGAFCLEAVEEALQQATPQIFNTDQGAQFTSHAFTSRVEPVVSKLPGLGSVGMDGDERLITSSSNAFGARSSMRRSTYTTTRASWKPGVA